MANGYATSRQMHWLPCVFIVNALEKVVLKQRSIYREAPPYGNRGFYRATQAIRIQCLLTIHAAHIEVDRSEALQGAWYFECISYFSSFCCSFPLRNLLQKCWTIRSPE